MNQYDINTVKVLEIELTTFCNANCGACDRNINGGPINLKMPLHHMSFDTWKQIVQDKNLSNISTLTFDGNFGDASMHPYIIKFLEYLSSIKNDLFIKISSNGGARNTKFWNELATALQKFRSHEMQFAIDGLEDTNHIYRRNVNWNKLIENVTAFNTAGGISTWRAIIFDHNKHQIKEMRNLAKQLNFYKFKTYRNRVTPIIVDKYKNLPKGILTSPTMDEFEKKYKMKKSDWDEVKTPGLRQDPNKPAYIGKMKKNSENIRPSDWAQAMMADDKQMMSEAQFDEEAGEKDACYHKVKSKYKVWPSAYASGALVQCRKKGKIWT